MALRRRKALLMLVLVLVLFLQCQCWVVAPFASSPQQRRSICSLMLFVTQQPSSRPLQALDERLMRLVGTFSTC